MRHPARDVRGRQDRTRTPKEKARARDRDLRISHIIVVVKRGRVESCLEWENELSAVGDLLFILFIFSFTY